MNDMKSKIIGIINNTRIDFSFTLPKMANNIADALINNGVVLVKYGKGETAWFLYDKFVLSGVVQSYTVCKNDDIKYTLYCSQNGCCIDCDEKDLYSSEDEARLVLEKIFKKNGD